ncbi:HAD family phosphatase [Postechiella marina]|uniref:HAD family phosphatase n=1 Tax=Postechiella marina TaxID=943941 RepID=A0ABP8CE84_9FLAO
MIKTIIFDFGNVFINLDIPGAIAKTYKKLEVKEIPEEITAFNGLYEQGLISTEEFIEFYLENFPNLSKEDVINTWNYILKDFPEHRLDFLKEIKASKKYKLILLSNTNDLHINWIKENVPYYNDFKACFDAFYLSHEINLSKPNNDIYEFVLNTNTLKANECIFIDDNKDNIESAKKLGINTWHLNPETDDVSQLFKINNNLF